MPAKQYPATLLAQDTDCPYCHRNFQVTVLLFTTSVAINTQIAGYLNSVWVCFLGAAIWP